MHVYRLFRTSLPSISSKKTTKICEIECALVCFYPALWFPMASAKNEVRANSCYYWITRTVIVYFYKVRPSNGRIRQNAVIEDVTFMYTAIRVICTGFHAFCAARDKVCQTWWAADWIRKASSLKLTLSQYNGNSLHYKALHILRPILLQSIGIFMACFRIAHCGHVLIQRWLLTIKNCIK